MKHLTLLLVLALPSLALAEGTDQLNTTQALRAGAQLYVDIVEPGTETIRWTGLGTATVTDPEGATIATLASGETADTTGYSAGAYGITNAQGQVVGIRWDVEVVGQTTSGGRLHSYDWMFNAGSFAASRATYASFYAVIPGGASGETAVIELQLDGLAGYVYNINANRIGVDGPNGGRSVPMYGHTVTPEFPMYLQPPTLATYTHAEPEAYNLDYVGGVSVDVDGGAIDPCAQVVPGESFGRFQFNTNVEGTYHLECDIDGDGLFETTNDDDFFEVGTTVPGLNTVLWNGTHNGAPVATGNYACRVRINAGEFHYVGSDIETSYQGMRMYSVASDMSRSPLTMRWNDSAVQASANLMASLELGLESSGEAGIDPGPYGLPAIANVNARSWGNHTSSGKGNQNYLDTYVWLASDTSTNVFVEAVDGSVDTDGDGLGDFAESCFYGTDPTNPDSDGDGTNDGEQYGSESSSGTVGGLESNGRLGSQLARRAIARSRFTAPAGLAERVGAAGLALTDPALGEITSIFDSLHVAGLGRVDSTPADLAGLTNADDVYAFDLVDGSTVQGSLLVVETIGELYEHSKALCDRAGGATLVDVGALTGLDVLQATYRHGEEGTLDQAVELKLYQRADGRWSTASRWLRDHYDAPHADQRVLNVQIWGHRPGLVQQLTNDLLRALGEDSLLVEDTNTPLDESTVDSWSRPTTVHAAAPSVAVTSATLLGSTLSFGIERFAGGPDGVQLRITRVAPDGSSMTSQEVDLGELAGARSVSVEVSLVRDLTVDVLEGERVVDRLWLSDGAWSAFDDAIWDGRTEASFSNECVSQPYFDGGIHLSGCGRASAENVDRFFGVARHIPRGVSLEEMGRVRFWYRSTHGAELCVEDTATGARSCNRLTASPSGRYAQLSLDGLRGDGERVRLVSLTQKRAGSLEMSALTFAPGTPVSAPSSGCSAAPGRGAPVTGLLLVSLVLFRRRRA
ncbi:MAG: hypothetical protein JJ863_34335 [Deltaproteobacteria bacterium]|nr:hypothetical protein [Deltaproteobacteria bacterium]